MNLKVDKKNTDLKQLKKRDREVKQLANIEKHLLDRLHKTIQA